MARIRRWAIAVGRAITSPAARWTLGVGCGVLVVGAAPFAIWGWLNLPFLDQVELALVSDVARRMEIRFEHRKAWLTALGGIVVAAGLMVAGWRSAAAMRQARAQLQQAKATEQGNITERFTRAIDQLGARHPDGLPNLEVRMGALYALEQISKDAPEDYNWQVKEIVTAYLREHAKEDTIGDTKLREDVSAATRVIELDLSGVYLIGTDFRAAQLEGANFRNAHLEDADFTGANLERADFRGANLEGADFTGANLERAYIYDSHLEGTYFASAHLEGADFTGANLEGADFMGATGLKRAQLCAAYFDETTTLTDGQKGHTKAQVCKEKVPVEGLIDDEEQG